MIFFTSSAALGLNKIGAGTAVLVVVSVMGIQCLVVVTHRLSRVTIKIGLTGTPCNGSLEVLFHASVENNAGAQVPFKPLRRGGVWFPSSAAVLRCLSIKGSRQYDGFFKCGGCASPGIEGFEQDDINADG